MAGKLFRFLLCICLLFISNTAFASVLSNVEVSSDGNIGKIILDTDKSSVYKKVLSDNNVQIKLKNTSIKENLKISYNRVPQNTEVSVMQNGKDAYISLFGANIAKYDMLFADDESLIPIRDTKKDTAAALIIMALVLLAGWFSKKMYKFSAGKTSASPELTTVIQQKNKIMAMNTLRNQSNSLKNQSIHGNPIAHFADCNKSGMVTVPNDLKISDVNYTEYSKELQNAVNT